MNPAIYVTSDLASLLRRFLATHPVDDAALMARLDQWPPHSRMPMTEWWALLEDIQAHLKLPALGVHIGSCVRPEDSGVMGYMTLHCQTVGDALTHFQRYQGLIHNFSHLQIEPHAGFIRLTWDVDRGISTQLSDEVFLAGLVTHVRHATGQRLCPHAVHFLHPAPGPAAPYEEWFGCPVDFDWPQVAIDMPLDALSTPVNTHNPHLLTLLEKQAEALLAETPQDAWIEQIQKRLVEQMTRGTPSLERLADTLSLSPRTLHRRLDARGLNFRQLLEITRKGLSRHYLDDPSLGLAEVAFLLGYSEQSVFTRAFRRWFGETPGQYRRRKTRR
ncbi:MAG: AraC family transcriptional regulator [Gammaproteobacteria bacterium]|nr:MAG: AraC family transcriptional regulator [Gammaproteobacteria bacterium]